MRIRKAHPSDIGDIARLTIELGYNIDARSLCDRVGRIISSPHDLVYVSESEGRIVGWVHSRAFVSLESGYHVEIVGLIVEEGFRRQGIGKALVEEAERWALEMGARVVLVRSNTRRVESHEFYPALGFDLAKTQAVYRKLLNKTGEP